MLSAHSSINKITTRTINTLSCFRAKNLLLAAYDFAKLLLFGLTCYKIGISLQANYFMCKFWTDPQTNIQDQT